MLLVGGGGCVLFLLSVGVFRDEDVEEHGKDQEGAGGQRVGPRMYLLLVRVALGYSHDECEEEGEAEGQSREACQLEHDVCDLPRAFGQGEGGLGSCSLMVGGRSCGVELVHGVGGCVVSDE